MQKIIILSILTTLRIHFSLKSWENVLFELFGLHFENSKLFNEIIGQNVSFECRRIHDTTLSNDLRAAEETHAIINKRKDILK